MNRYNLSQIMKDAHRLYNNEYQRKGRSWGECLQAAWRWEKDALIGETTAELTYSGSDSVHRIILMHGAKAKIRASKYAVILIVNISGWVEIEKDETVAIL